MIVQYRCNNIDAGRKTTFGHNLIMTYLSSSKFRDPSQLSIVMFAVKLGRHVKDEAGRLNRRSSLAKIGL